jgi:hypothetical protein
MSQKYNISSKIYTEKQRQESKQDEEEKGRRVSVIEALCSARNRKE